MPIKMIRMLKAVHKYNPCDAYALNQISLFHSLGISKGLVCRGDDGYWGGRRPKW